MICFVHRYHSLNNKALEIFSSFFGVDLRRSSLNGLAFLKKISFKSTSENTFHFNRLVNALLTIVVFTTVLFLYTNKARISLFLGVPQREAQNASQTRYFYKNGIDLFYPQYDLTPEPQFLVLEFPFYHAVVATINHLLGFQDIWGKLLSVLAAEGSMVYLFLLGNKYFKHRVLSLLAVIFFAVAPFNVRFIPVFMVDPTVIFLSLVTLYHGVLWIENSSKLNFWVFFLAGLLACLIKFVIFVPVSVPLGILFLLSLNKPFKQHRWRIFSFALVVYLWLSAIAGWAIWSSYVNGQTTLQAFDTSASTSASIAKFIGTLSMRFDPHYLDTMRWIFSEFAPQKVPSWLLAFIFVVCLLATFMKGRRKVGIFIGSWAFGFLLMFAVFFPAVSTHSYYWLASIPIVAFLLANALDGLFDFVPNHPISITLKSGWQRVLSIVFLSITGITLLWFGAEKIFNGFQVFQWNSPNKYDFVSGMVILLFLAFLLVLLIGGVFLRRLSLHTIITILLLGLISIQFYTHLFWWYERYWNLTNHNGVPSNGLHWVTSPLLIQETEFIKNNHNNLEPVAIVTKYTYYPHILYMSGSHGYTLTFPEQEPNINCATANNFPHSFSNPCVSLLYQQGIRDVFVVFLEKGVDMSEEKFKELAPSLNLEYVNEMREYPESYGNVIHYRIRFP